MLWPNASSPISTASNITSGARKRRDVSSIMRMAVSGAACTAHSGQTPSVLSAATEPESSAVVRLSGGGALAISAVSTLAEASAMAVVRPAGPPPTTATSHSPLMLLFLANPGLQDDRLSRSFGLPWGREHNQP